MEKIAARKIKKIAEEALKEDVGRGDITTNSLIDAGVKTRAGIIANEDCVASGLPIVKEVFRILDKNCRFKGADDGEAVKKGEIVLEIYGNARAILTGERTALNFLQHMSGIATETRKLVDLAGGKFDIYDTRKTHPGLRYFEKYAVRCGGGVNHRLGLYDMVLIKDNHLKYLQEADKNKTVKKIKELKKRYKIEIECANSDELNLALDLKPDIIMLDNMGKKQLSNAIKIIRKNLPKTLIEVSGGLDRKRIRDLQNFDIDYVSVGGITHSSKDINFSLEF